MASVQMKTKQKEGKREISDEQAEVISKLLYATESTFGLSEENSNVAAVLESSLVAETREKELQNTLSWVTNCLIRLYFVGFKGDQKF